VLLGLVSNIRLYGGTVILSQDARLDDGLLDVELFCGDGPLDSVAHLGAVLAGRHDAPARRSGQAARARFVTSPPLPVHLDGEPFATTPIRFHVCPGALRLLVPPGAPTEIFSDGMADRLSAAAGAR
jgi:diacylglycerol kinase family enzyme